MDGKSFLRGARRCLNANAIWQQTQELRGILYSLFKYLLPACVQMSVGMKQDNAGVRLWMMTSDINESVDIPASCLISQHVIFSAVHLHLVILQ